MTFINIEIKARCDNPEGVEEILESLNARFIGEDLQIDTYFSSIKGRLKLREGNIENTLIHYIREDKAGPKKSDVILYKNTPKSELKNILVNSLDVLCVVDKTRKIYFIDNVKFHIDRIKGLGSFIEIEAIDKSGNIGELRLKEQCNYYLNLFKIKIIDLINNSYSDMVMKDSSNN